MNTPPLAERLWGKTKSLALRVAEIGSGRIAMNTVAGAIAGKPDEEKQKQVNTDIEQKETMGQIDLNARMGYHSDKLGNRTTPIEGFNKEAGQNADPISFDADKTAGTRTLEALPSAIKETVTKAVRRVKNGNTFEYVAPKEEEKPQIVNTAQADVKNGFNKELFRAGIVYNETRGAKDPYIAVGPTNDLGRYQASPATLKGWSKAWLGKEYTPDEFLKNPTAQEKFFEEFTKVAERLNLTHEQAAVAWHRGWGELGTGDKKTRDKRFLDRLNRMMEEDISNRYLDSFRKAPTSTPQTQP